jgi:hypothetical protein
MFMLSYPRARHAAAFQGLPADTRLLCDKAAGLEDKIKDHSVYNYI